MSAAEFGGREFAAGTVAGVREFRVDGYGRLTGVVHKKVWKPEENIARCFLDPYEAAMRSIAAAPIFGGPVMSHPQYVSQADYLDSIEGRAIGRDHQMVRCQCGFYAYFDGSRDYRSDATIAGVVEGYGEVLLGTRGFRAAKARIVALTIPDPHGEVGEAMIRRVRRNYEGVPYFPTFDAMVAEFPPDYSQELSPTTDPKFWER